MYAPGVLGFLRVRDQAGAEDVLGDVFLDVVRTIHSFEGGPDAFRAWLFRIASNRFIDEHRRRRRRPEHSTDQVPEQADRDVADVVAEAEDARRVEACLRVLPPDQRTAVYLRSIVGMSFADVARAMGRSEGSAKMLHGRALRTLAPRMRPDPASTVTNPNRDALD